MVSTVGAIVLTTGAAILLSVATLTTMAPWAVISLILAGLYSIGKHAQQCEAQDTLAHRLCRAWPALRRLP
jgi:hypothetical protein